jgi:hypothetical protein
MVGRGGGCDVVVEVRRRRRLEVERFVGRSAKKGGLTMPEIDWLAWRGKGPAISQKEKEKELQQQLSRDLVGGDNWS